MVRALIAVACTRQHVRNVKPRPEYVDEKWRQRLDRDGMEGFLETFARGIVPEDDPRHCMAIVGVMPMWPGVAEVWTVLSEEILAYPKPLIRILRQLDKECVQKLRIWRLQAIADVRHESFSRFLEHFGLQREGYMRSYLGYRQDAWLYARVTR